MSKIVKDKTVMNAVTLANATDLVADIMLQISGNDISNSLNNSPINRSLICTIAQSRIAKVLKEQKAI